MEKTAIEYIIDKNKEFEKKNEIKNELINKIRNFRGLPEESKEEIINDILSEFKSNESSEAVTEIIKQNKDNKERNSNLKYKLLRIKSEIQKENRRLNTLKKQLLKEDFSGADISSIKNKKNNRDKKKQKIEQSTKKICELKKQKELIENEIYSIEIIDDNKKQHRSRKSFEQNNTSYKGYKINDLLKFDIGLSENLKNKILNTIKIAKNNNKEKQFNNDGSMFFKIIKNTCLLSIFVVVVFALISAFGDEAETLIVLGLIAGIIINSKCKKIEKYNKTHPNSKKKLNIFAENGGILIYIIIFYIILLIGFIDKGGK